MKRKSEYYPPFKDGGEVVVSWGEARLIKYLDGKSELKGGTKEDQLAAQEWISLFWQQGVVEESVKRASEIAAAGGHNALTFV